MLRFVLIAGVLCTLSSAPARAQDGRQIFFDILGTILDAAQQDQQRRALEKRLKPHIDGCERGEVASCDELLKWPLNPQARAAVLQVRAKAAAYAAFARNWDLCFNHDNIVACDQSLTYTGIVAADSKSLRAQRNRLVEARQAEARRLEEERRRRQAPTITLTFEEGDRTIRWTSSNIQSCDLLRPNGTSAVGLKLPSRSYTVTEPGTYTLDCLSNAGTRVSRHLIVREHVFPSALDKVEKIALGLFDTPYGGLALIAPLIASMLVVLSLLRSHKRTEARAAEPHMHDTIDRSGAAEGGEVGAPQSQMEPPSEPLTPPDPRAQQLARDNLELAEAYFQEIHEQLGDFARQPALARELLNTLSLATRQLEQASSRDPTANLTVTLKEGGTVDLTQDQLRAKALFYEGLCIGIEEPKKAIPILERAAALWPDHAMIQYWLGSFHRDLFNKEKAIEHLSNAVALTPDEIEWRKHLDRAVNLSEGSVRAHRIAQGASTTMQIGRWVFSGVCALILIILAYNLIVLLTATDKKEQGEALAVLVVFMAISGGVMWIGLKIRAVKSFFTNFTRFTG